MCFAETFHNDFILHSEASGKRKRNIVHCNAFETLCHFDAHKQLLGCVWFGKAILCVAGEV